MLYLTIHIYVYEDTRYLDAIYLICPLGYSLLAHLMTKLQIVCNEKSSISSLEKMFIAIEISLPRNLKINIILK